MDVADAAEETVENEVEGLWWSLEADGLRCSKLIIFDPKAEMVIYTVVGLITLLAESRS